MQSRVERGRDCRRRLTGQAATCRDPLALIQSGDVRVLPRGMSGKLLPLSRRRRRSTVPVRPPGIWPIGKRDRRTHSLSQSPLAALNGKRSFHLHARCLTVGHFTSISADEMTLCIFYCPHRDSQSYSHCLFIFISISYYVTIMDYICATG